MVAVLGFFTLLTFVQLWHVNSENCSTVKCSCIYGKRGLEADCSNLDLPEVPTFSENVELIILKGNSIKRIHTLKNLPKVRYLDISHCRVKYIDNGAFQNLRSLEYLDISFNEELGFAGLPNVTTNMTKTNIRVFKFNHINCPDGTTTMVRKRHLMHLKYTHVEELYANGNRIELFEYGLLSDLPKTIKIVSVSENKLGVGKYLLEINHLSELVYFNASFRMPPLEFINSVLYTCSENQDNCFDEKQTNSPTTEKIISTNYTFMVDLPPKLETIDFTGSKMFATLNPQLGNFKVNNLKKVLLQGNWLTTWYASISGYINVTFLDISNNLCSYIATNIMTTILKSMLFFNMSNNEFGNMFSSDTFGKIFEKGARLQNLDLSYNRIHSLPQNIFKNLKHIEYLNISGNNLMEWNVNTRHMRYVKSLDLSNNSISSFSVSAMQDLEALMSSTNVHVSIDLSGNPISCSCDNPEFLHWMNNRKSHFKNSDKYKCSKTEKGLSRVFDFISTMDEKCRSYTPLYVAISVSVSLISSITISFAMYKYRWKLRYLRYNFIQRFFMGRNNEQWDGYERIYEYDAYVSYVGIDREFVCQHLIPNLESNTDIKLLIRDRTFSPGHSKIYEILQSIQQSKRTICVVSKSYSKSGWRDFELNMAVIEGIESRKTHDFVYLIIFPDVYDANILKLVKNKYYVEYPNDSNGYSGFWHNLRDIIRSDYKNQ